MFLAVSELPERVQNLACNRRRCILAGEVTRASARSVRVFIYGVYNRRMEERVCVFIDGGNFYHLVLKKLGVYEQDFGFDQFAAFLANGRTVADMGKRYYIGTVREKEGDLRSKEAMSRQTALFTRLKATSWELKTSKLRVRNEKLVIDSRVESFEKIKKLGINEIKFTRNREKGIDVKIVTDLFTGAFDNKYDTAIIVSSDTDLVPAIDSVRHRFHKRVEYVGFSITDPVDPKNNTSPILSMIPHTDIQRTLIESDLRHFIRPSLI